MNEDIKYSLLKYIHTIDDLKSYCRQNKSFYNICKSSKTSIARHFLDVYKVDYKDPNNFIYKYNKKNISEYIIGSEYNLQSIFKLYMKTYYLKEIKCQMLMISSIPILPNMKAFYANNNQLTTFPIQPNMKLFHASNNQLTTFPIQPNMTHFVLNNNELTSFPIQPKMELFMAINNQIITFPIQPNLHICRADNNPLDFCLEYQLYEDQDL